MNPEKMLAKLREHKIAPFRARQILHAIFREGVDDFLKITTLPLGLRKELSETVDIYGLSPKQTRQSADRKTQKVLFETGDGYRIEAVLMQFRDGRNSVCVSCQAGCRLGCSFCATGKMGFFRDLDAGEILDQVLYFSHILAKSGEKVTNVIYMGMGEPLMNYDQVMDSIRFLNDKQLLNIGARSITVSTSGICEGIEKLAEEPLQVNLAVSLHAADQQTREKLMPVARMYSLDQLMSAVKSYISKTNRRVSFEYVMLKDLNDRDQDARNLASLTKDLLCHINLIPYNATGAAGIIPSDRKKINRFAAMVGAFGIPVTVRVSLGQDIMAACGQLANK